MGATGPTHWNRLDRETSVVASVTFCQDCVPTLQAHPLALACIAGRLTCPCTSTSRPGSLDARDVHVHSAHSSPASVVKGHKNPRKLIVFRENYEYLRIDVVAVF